MYNNKYFYGIIDLMHFNVYASLLREYIIKEERVILKVFKRDKEIVVIETNNFVDTILKDTRKDKNSNLMEFDLIFLKTLERYYSDYEIEGMVYEYIEGIGAWYKVEIPGYSANDKFLKPFFLKKKIERDELKKYATNEDELNKLVKFYDITKGLVKFSTPNKVKKLFLRMEE